MKLNKRSNKLPSAEILRAAFRYDAETGKLFWLMAPRKGRAVSGTEAGKKDRNGYIIVGFMGSIYMAHRIIWKMVTGDDPINILDHASSDNSDNRFENLREANDSQNHGNRRLSKNNRSGLKGVHYSKQREKWVAQIMVNYKNIPLGRYDTKELAYAAYCVAAKSAFGEFARLS